LLELWLKRARVVYLGEKILPHILADLELNRVIAGSDGLYVPLDCRALEHPAEVINERNEEKGDENGHATNKEALNLSLLNLLLF
jgi:hypothetical protein